MASVLKVDKLDPQSGTDLEIGTSGDTVSIPSGATLDISASTLTPPATLPASSGVNLTALNATNLGSGTVPTARLGTGTASSSTVLYGDQTYKAEPGGGKVLQVVNAVQSTEYTTSSGSYGASSTGITITPSATSSKVLIQIHCGQIEMGNREGQGIVMKLTRTIGASDTDLIAQLQNGAGAFTGQTGNVYRTFTGHASVSYLDSPSTTSATQYRIYVKSSQTTTYIGVQMHTTSSTFTAMEIGA